MSAKKVITCATCGKTANHGGKGQCGACYNRALRAARGVAKRPPAIGNITCPDCGEWREHDCRGRCKSCYRRLRRSEVNAAKPPKPGPVTRVVRECVECHRMMQIKSLDRCSGCYSRGRKRPDAVRRVRNHRIRECVTCHRQAEIEAKDMCNSCYKKDLYRRKMALRPPKPAKVTTPKVVRLRAASAPGKAKKASPAPSKLPPGWETVSKPRPIKPAPLIGVKDIAYIHPCTPEEIARAARLAAQAARTVGHYCRGAGLDAMTEAELCDMLGVSA